MISTFFDDAKVQKFHDSKIQRFHDSKIFQKKKYPVL